MLDRFKMVIFDIDGTLVSLFPEHARSYANAFTAVTGKKFINIEYLYELFATGSETKVFEELLKDAGIPPTPRLVLKMRKLRPVYFGRELENVTSKNILPGALETIIELKKEGKAVVCFSGSSRKVAEKTLRRTGLIRLFPNRFFVADNHKMVDKASVLRHIVRVMKTDPKKCCVIGDTPADVRAAIANGMGHVAVSTGLHSRKELKKAGKTIVLSRLDLKKMRETVKPTGRSPIRRSVR